MSPSVRMSQAVIFEVIEAVIIGHVWRDKLDQSHAHNKTEEKCNWNKMFLHARSLQWLTQGCLFKLHSF